MKAILMSIRPKACELIASGKQTVIVRKTRPNIETPFKVYIYMTAGDAVYPVKINGAPYTCSNVGGKVVIGEFTCDWITSCKAMGEVQAIYNEFHNTCLTSKEIIKYANGKRLYYMHISDLVIYDRAKSLREFTRFCDGVGGKIGCNGCEYYYTESNESVGFYEECGCDNSVPLKRPPSSWCYVEERGANNE